MVKHIKAWNDEYRRSSWKGHYSLKSLDTVVKKGRLLDAGCGSGKYSLPLKMRGFNVVSVDVSLRAVHMLRESSKAHELDIGITAGNIYQLPFINDSFDFIWCYCVLSHLLSDEREYAIKEFHRILRKDGLLFIEVFGKEDMRYGGVEVEPDTFSRENGIIHHYFDKSELEGLLADFSSKITESRKEKRFKGKLFIRHMIYIVSRNS